MITTEYASPLGPMLLAADEAGLTGAWFAGQKYFARGLADAQPGTSDTLAQAARIKNGADVRDRSFPDGTFRVYAEDGSFLMLGRSEGGTLSVIKNFFEVT